MKRNLKKFKTISMAIALAVCNISGVFAQDLSTNNEPKPITVFDRTNNTWGAKYFRIPSMQTLSDGTLLAFSDIRYNGAPDHAFIDIGAARSTDGGKTWDYQTVMENDRVNPKFSRVMDSTTVVTDTGRIILIAGSWNKDGNWAGSTPSLREDWSVQMVYSDDNGSTWSDKIDLTTNTERINNQPSNTIGWLGGVGAGITMEDGTIVMPIQIALRENNANNYYSSIIYSKDNGETWTMGNKVPDKKTSENMVIELDGALIMSARYDSTGYRASYISYDLGSTWEIYEPLHEKILTGAGSGCQGSFIKVEASNGHEIGLISAPKNTAGGYVRDNITVYMIDFDDLSKGIKEVCVPYPENGNPSGGGYSCLSFNDDKLNILYEADGNIVYKDLSDNFDNYMVQIELDALKDLVSETKTLVEDNYTKKSWEKVEIALKKAEKVLDSKNVKLKELTKVKENLEEAKSNLI